ncbi:CHAT domain-containing protein [Massilia sp. H6]|uniref:CHAT domain-containing protein n=1 Tax=Massilia sp. H6 TaxID=2970464 RepID=UPI0021677A7E|nr:CHAT domain-containing protein [Massilia sp. H6]UVW27036.1 CHAT domain-containing protein [Massilia sp. H6]
MSDSAVDRPISLTITGRRLDSKPMPAAFLRTGPRRTATPDPGAAPTAQDADDDLLPPGLVVLDVIDVSPATRDTEATRISLQVEPGQIVVLELADGGTLVANPSRLKEALDRAGASQSRNSTLSDLDKLGPDTGRHRGALAMLKGVISKISLIAVPDSIEDTLLQGIDLAQDGISWLGTKALMAAIEGRQTYHGLCRWKYQADDVDELASVILTTPGDQPPPDAELLVFVHGTGSSTLGSFGHLRTAEPELWNDLCGHYGDHIYGFEHRTLSQSPIENALELVQSLPHGAHISLVSHSRGGLVADLLCLADFGAQIEHYRYPFHSPGTRDAKQRRDILRGLEDAYGEQRELLLKLAGELRERKLVIRRYARIASPANGTLLASGNFDVFLSGLLTLLHAVPFLYTSVLYRIFRRAVIEIAKRRTDPHLVPGIEAMLPDSPLAQFLSEALVKPDIQMAVIAGDVDGGDMLSRLRVALTDFVLFDKQDNDLVVDTPAMLAGIAPQAKARVLFERGAHVSHFRYCSNSSSRLALRDWLISRDPTKLDRFIAIPGREAITKELEVAKRRGNGGTARLPIVVVLPDMMASHLKEKHTQLWYPPVPGDRGLELLALNGRNVEATEVIDVLYAKLCAELVPTHQVFTFPYDWRQPLRKLGERLASFLERFRDTPEPVRLIAHGMGGLLVRACTHASEQRILEVLMRRDGARIVMLGTANRGTHAVVADLLGKGDGLRSLWRQQFRSTNFHDLLSTFAAFPGMLSMLPTRDFADAFDIAPGASDRNYYNEAYWRKLSELFSDRWFGENCGAVPNQALLSEAGWLAAHDAQLEQRGETPLPSGAEPKTIYVFGVAQSTPCGIAEAQAGLLGTAAGDGIVTWESGRLPWIDSYYFMPARHGDLLATQEHFPAILELLKTGTTRLLAHEPPTRPADMSGTVLYDAAPPTAADTEAVQRCLVGGSLRSRVPAGPLRRLDVTVRAMDLRFVSSPIMVGHYEQDPISGAEAQIDRELLDGDLSRRYNLGAYAGARGSATVVLRDASSSKPGGRLSGAVVAGLGRYDGTLSASELTEAVRVGALRFLLQVMDVLGKDERQLELSSLLLGFNSSANLSVASSVEALVRGVMSANERFHERTGLNIRIGVLNIVELYLDTAIAAVYALRDLRDRLKQIAYKQHTELSVCDELVSGEGVRQRLHDTTEASYWPRIIITDASHAEEHAFAEPLPIPTGQKEAPIADRLRFMYIGSRARAETTVQQRQPSLIETLVRQQIDSHKWNPDFGRMLFQLMVPHDFKDAVRQLDRLVLVVDGYTANLPWELMLADSAPDGGNDLDHEQTPLAVRASVVRQLSALRYRPQVVQAIAYSALVIGNPSVRGFRTAFADSGGNSRTNGSLAPLRGARDEASTIQQVLTKHGYEVEGLIGEIGDVGAHAQSDSAAQTQATALARSSERHGPRVDGGRGEPTDATHVLAALYRQPWRILHVSGHGVYNIKHKDGRFRSGVVLSDGLLITAAEVAAMEVVPELVFLNSCHSGQFDGGRQSNRLAASIARELIEIGVRCVLVAGWAVDDALARMFGTTFYEQLLGQRKQFGEAVKAARKTVWDENRADLTWGAFQAYGDPGWMAEAGTDNADGPVKETQFVSLEEMLDALSDLRVRLSHRREAFADKDSALITKQLELLLTKRCQPKWLERPELHAAIGATRRELNQIRQAYDAFLRAVQLEDKFGQVSVRNIEQLAEVEAQYGEQCAERALTRENGEEVDQIKLQQDLEESGLLLERALLRLVALDRLSSVDAGERCLGRAGPDQPPATAGLAVPATAPPKCQRQALRGRIHRRKASVHARHLLAPCGRRIEQATWIQDQMEEELRHATDAYKVAEGSPALGHFAPQLALSRLALEALAGLHTTPEAQGPAITFARLCAHDADTGQSGNAAAALLRAKALLVETLITGILGDDGPGGQAAFENILQGYADATRGIALKPSELDAIVTDIEELARLYGALSTRDQGPDESWARIARTREHITDNLRKLARRLQPARTQAGGKRI